MAFYGIYEKQVALLVRVLPFVAEEQVFALKGGTAINLFVRDLPRLSVDIDLTYLPISDRASSFSAIDAAMLRLETRLARAIAGARISPVRSEPEQIVTKLIVAAGGVRIKIEANAILRGSVSDPVLMRVKPVVENAFGFARIQVLPFADLYAGKIMAALARQHPRDLFDVRDLLANEGISDELRRTFIAYLISHNRAITDIVAPTRKPLAEEFKFGFEGMTAEPVALADLEAAREAMIASILGDMPEAHRHFLISFKRGEPRWDFLGVERAQAMPAVDWKLLNLAKMSPGKREAEAQRLERALFP